MTPSPSALAKRWRDKAVTLREEAGRIRRTVYEPTGAEERCNVRAEIYDKCANELEACLASALQETPDQQSEARTALTAQRDEAQQDRAAQFAHNTALTERLTEAERDNDMVNEYLARLEGIVNGTGGTGHIKWDLHERVAALVADLLRLRRLLEESDAKKASEP